MGTQLGMEALHNPVSVPANLPCTPSPPFTPTPHLPQLDSFDEFIMTQMQEIVDEAMTLELVRTVLCSDPWKGHATCHSPHGREARPTGPFSRAMPPC